MRTRLVGIHKVRAKLASGAKATYYYAWRGGPRMKEKPHTRAFLLEYYRLTKERPEEPASGTLGDLIRSYLQSEKYRGRAEATRKGYDWAISKIEDEYFNLPLEAIGQRGARKMFVKWRDSFAETPRAADMILSVLSMILAFGVDQEDLDRNPLEKIDRLADSTRRDTIWTDEQISAFHAKAPPRLVLALELARWTGQRQGDLLRLTWGAYDGTHISLRQEKTGAHVRVMVAQELRTRLDAEKARRLAKGGDKIASLTIITNRSGRPYTEGFRASWAKACKAAGVEGVTFHDLRGTFVTLAYRDGATFKDIAEVTGHSEKDAEGIIRKHYLKADSAVTKLEAGNKKRREV
jgi:integrase